MESKFMGQVFLTAVLTIMMILAIATFLFVFKTTNLASTLNKQGQIQNASVARTACITQIRTASDIANSSLLTAEGNALRDVATDNKAAFDSDLAALNKALADAAAADAQVKKIDTLCPPIKS